MSLSYEIRESASSVAKKYDHSELTNLHILYGIRRKFPEQLSKLSVEEIEKRISALPRVPSNVMVVSEEVEDLLSKIQYPQEALELAKTLAAQLLEINLEELSTRTVEASAESAQEKLSLSDSLEQLNKLIGLNEVKTQVSKLINVHQANNIRSAQGLPKVPVGLHCVFTGSPGTGKTTVARYLASMYNSIGLLPSNKVYEVDRSALVAGYVGQTALKVQDAVEKAKGGVLFIDEAYSLSADSGAGFGDEAISTLVKAMEDHRENLAIIVAGYKEPMKQFIESNQGLKSRFQNYIHFNDYSSQELLSIFEELCHSHKMEIDQLAKVDLLKHIEAAKPQGDQGNARYIRNLFEKMYLNMSHRAAEDGNIDLHEILKFDSRDIPSVEVRKQTIGFAPKKDPT
jgi:ATP-dependent Clp protease ATP-binding subunit ClpA